MARPGTTREQVFTTADALVLEGQAPTVVAVRKKLGGGSPNTITPLLAEWKELNETKKAETTPPLPDSVESAMRQVWGAAWKAAQVQLEAERAALGAARKDIERERSEMLTEIGRLDGDLDEAREEARRAAEGLRVEQGAHEQTRAEAREARAIAEERDKRIASQEAELREVRRQAEAAGGKVALLEANLVHAQADLDAARDEARKQADARAALVRETDGFKRDLAQALAVAEQARTELESVRNHAREAKAIADASGKKIQRLEAIIEEERQARAAAEKALADLRVEAATFKGWATQVDELRELVQGLRGQAATKTAPWEAN